MFAAGAICTVLTETVLYSTKSKYAGSDENITAQNIGEGPCKIAPSDADLSRIGKADPGVFSFRKGAGAAVAEQENNNAGMGEGLGGFIVVNKPAGLTFDARL